MRDLDYSSAVDFLVRFYEGTEHAVEIRVFPNSKGDKGGGSVFTRDPQTVQDHCNKWARPGFGTFFGVATRQLGSPTGQRKDLVELSAVWSEIDTEKLGLDKTDVVRAVLDILCPPSIIIDSGRGLHLYWLLREAINVSMGIPGWEETEATIVAVLKQLAGIMAGDTNVCDLTRVMRLPSTHNTKDGKVRLTSVIDATWARYELSDLIDMLYTQRPVVRRPAAAETAADNPPDNPFSAFGQKYAFKTPVDIQRRLSAMRYEADGDAGVHQTQLSVSASLVTHGMADDEIVDLVLQATMVAAGPVGSGWNWRREEAGIAGMVRTARVKFGRPDRPAQSAAVIQLRSGGARAEEDEETVQENAPSSGDDQRPTVRLRSGMLHDTATLSEQILKDANAPLYVRSGAIVRPVVEDVEAARGLRTEVARLSTVTVTGMVDWLSRSANWLKYDGRSKSWVPVDPPSELAATILSRDGEWMLPPLVGVITTPTLRPDGSILDRAGYDAATRLLLLRPPPMPPMVMAPRKDDAVAALDLLKGLLTDFSFVDAASLSVALSALITPVIRGALSVAPLHAMRAPSAGSGKSYLVDLASAISTGQRCPVISAGKSDEEQEKRLGAALISGQPIVSIDNLNGELTGDALCQMVERPVVKIRPLGRSELVQIETRATVYATGNNIVIVGDMVRRVVTCSLDPNLERPELRQFDNNPLDTILANRGKYIAACMTVVRAYITAGYPDRLPALASYEDWSLLVRSALVWLGCADPVDTMEASRDDDPETAEIRDVFNAWRAAIGVNISKSCGEIIKVAEEQEYTIADEPYQKSVPNGYRFPEFREALIAVAGDRHGISSRRLGWWFLRYRGRLVMGAKIVGRLDRRAKTNRWELAGPSDEEGAP